MKQRKLDDRGYPVETKRGTYEVIFSGNGVRVGVDEIEILAETDIYYHVKPGEIVLLLCTIKDVMTDGELYSQGLGLQNDDVMCLTRFGLLWIQSNQLREL